MYLNLRRNMMKRNAIDKSITILAVSMVLITTSQSVAAITIDFESFPIMGGVIPTYTEQGVTFSASGGGGGLWASEGPNGTLGLLDMCSPKKELRADIGLGASSVSVDLGDYNVDSDLIFLEIFDSADNLIDYTDMVISETFVGMETLTLSAPNIAYAVFGARNPGKGSTVYADNFTFEEIAQVIPSPGAIMLASIGVVCVGWLRRSRSL
jgi:hypothetical protein